MKYYPAVSRNACSARNAYSQASALRAAFLTTTTVTKTTTTNVIPDEEADPDTSSLEQPSPLQITATVPAKDEIEAPSKASHVMVKGTIPRFSNSQDWRAHMIRFRRNALRLERLMENGVKFSDSVGNALQYEARSIKPDNASTQSWPWHQKARDGEPWMKAWSSPAKHLDAEIRSFSDHMQMTTVERIARDTVAREVEQFIDATVNSTERTTGYEIFGSEKTGLALPISDIDIRIWDTDAQDSNRKKPRIPPQMHKLFLAIKESDKFVESVYRHQLKHPMIVACHRESGINIQIVATPGNAAQQAMTARYLEEIPHLREVFLVMRTAFAVRGLLDVYNGGLGSYGTFMLVAAALQYTPKEGPTFQLRPYHQLLKVLHFIRELDTSKHGVAVFPRPKFMKHDATPEIENHILAANRRKDAVRAGQWAIGRRFKHQPWRLCLQDPAAPRNDLGRTSLAILHIQATVRSMVTSLSKRYVQLREDLKSREWPNISQLFVCVGTSHIFYAESRKKLEAYGRKVMEEGKERDRVRLQQERPATLAAMPPTERVPDHANEAYFREAESSD